VFIPTLSWILCCCCVVAAVVVFIVVVVLVVNLPVLCGPEPGGHPLKTIPEKEKNRLNIKATVRGALPKFSVEYKSTVFQKL
jgi:hypothetical protein